MSEVKYVLEHFPGADWETEPRPLMWGAHLTDFWLLLRLVNQTLVGKLESQVRKKFQSLPKMQKVGVGGNALWLWMYIVTNHHRSVSRCILGQPCSGDERRTKLRLSPTSHCSRPFGAPPEAVSSTERNSKNPKGFCPCFSQRHAPKFLPGQVVL